MVGADEGVCVEGRIPHQHFVEEHAHAPPVALPAVLTGAALRFQDLKGKYYRQATFELHNRNDLST